MKKCIDVLDEFLHDMNELEMQQSVSKVRPLPNSNAVGPSAKRRINTAPAPVKKKKKQSWLRRKEELETLRLQKAEMETTVAWLQMLQQNTSWRRKLETEELRKWEATALSERRRSQLSREENDALKAKLRSYVQTANAFQSMITGDSFEEQLVGVLSSTRPVQIDLRAVRQLQISSPSTFSMLERRIDRKVHEIQAIVDEGQHSKSLMDSTHVQIRNDSGEGSVMEYKCDCVLPFSEDVTLNAAWSIVEVGGIPQKQLSQVGRRTENEYWIDSRFVVPLERNGSAIIDAHIVIKRFEVSGGYVLLAEGTSDWSILQEHAAALSFTTQESVWAVCRGYPLESKDVCHQTSASQIKVQVRSKTATLSEPDFVLSPFRELIESQRQFLENTLLDSTRVG